MHTEEDTRANKEREGETQKETQRDTHKQRESMKIQRGRARKKHIYRDAEKHRGAQRDIHGE